MLPNCIDNKPLFIKYVIERREQTHEYQGSS